MSKITAQNVHLLRNFRFGDVLASL